VTLRSYDTIGTVIDRGGSGSVVSFRSGEDRDSTLSGYEAHEGFTIRNGTGTLVTRGEYACGGVFCCFKSSPTIQNNIIEANTVTRDSGGGLWLYKSSRIVRNNIVTTQYSS